MLLKVEKWLKKDVKSHRMCNLSLQQWKVRLFNISISAMQSRLFRCTVFGQAMLCSCFKLTVMESLAG